ncbi:MAG TPA: peroxiredoxin-like family protein [Acidimicrobiia bacterium]
MSLQEELAARVGGAKNWDPERKAAYQAQADALAASDILEKALRTGDRAPMFELPDAFGTIVRLAELLERGPVVLSFYRGSWCPFCNLELRALQRELESASAAGVTLVAVSPNTPDMSRELLEEGGLTFPVLSDHECGVASQFNLVYEMVPEQVEYYRNHDRDLGEMNGTDTWCLPVPATYVIDRDGTIRYDFIDLNHRVRAEPSEVVALAASLR